MRKTASRTRKSAPPAPSPISYDIAGIAVVAFGVISLVSLASPREAGELGRDIESLLRLMAGTGAYIVPALAFLAGAVGYLVGDRESGPPTSAVDTGFLQDMIDHHEQAVTMASLANGSASNPVVRHLAREVLIEQRYEIGLMDGYLQARAVADRSPLFAAHPAACCNPVRKKG